MAPRLVFVPPLGSTTKVPLGHTCSSSVTFKIYVNVYREWFTKFRTEGRRIEVWSDLPGGGRHQGEWGETPFVEQALKASSPTPSDFNLSDADDLPISLLSSDIKPEVAATPVFTSDKKVTLVATFTVPQTYSHYSYTFRIAGPGNRVEWLGSMGSNGVVVVGEPTHRAGFEEDGVQTGTWTSLDESAARKWEREDTGSDLVEIGRFKNVDMVGWAFGKNGFSEKVAPTRTSSGANLFLLHPRLDARIASRPFTDPPSSIVVSSADNTTILTEDGVLMTTAQSVSIQEFYPFTLPTDLQCATSQDWETVEVPEGAAPGFVLVKSGGDPSLLASSVPASLAILPAVSGDTLPSTSIISLPLPFIFTLQPSQPLNMLYSPVNDAVHVLDFSKPDVQAIQNVSLLVGRDGGEMIVVPAYEIGAPEETEEHEEEQVDEDIWTVAILEPSVTSVGVVREEPAPAPVDDPATPEIALEADVVVLSTPLVTATKSPLSEVETLDLGEKAEDTTSTNVATIEELQSEVSRVREFIFDSFLTVIHVILGLIVLILAHARIEEEEQQKDKAAGTETAPEATTEKDEEKKEETAPIPDVPTQDDSAETASDDKKDLAKMAANRHILTPPMTPPQSPATSLTNRLGITTVVTEADYFVEPPQHEKEQQPLPERAEEPHVEVTAPVEEEEAHPDREPEVAEEAPAVDEAPIDKKTKLIFTLPPYAMHFKLILHHANGDETADVHRIKIELDHKEVTTVRPSLGANSWLVDVDASHKTAGRVQVSVA